MTYFEKVQEVIDLLNSNNVRYLVLRNFENLLDDNIYVGGHEDIDFLVEDAEEVVSLLGAISNMNIPDHTHYHVYIAGNRVNIDLRHVGDGYYCTKWEADLLDNRVFNNGFYIMDSKNYFYTLCYHAILQKRTLSEEYLCRLNSMALELSLPSTLYGSQENLLKGLEEYMLENNYMYSYTKDPSIPLRFNLVEKKMILKHWFRMFNHYTFGFRYFILCLVGKIIHLVKRKIQ